jgi:hypothetical protein
MLWADYFLHDDGGPKQKKKQKTSEMFQKKYKKEIKVG